MEFTQNYDDQEFPRTQWTTKFYINDEHINGYRTIKRRPYNLQIPITEDVSFKSVMEGIDRITRIDDELFQMMAESVKRANRDDSDA